ncbi:hypothetical protein [Nocardia amamiensis]|uniref:hypothetical protein n=1 Tax=Nocardia amamiensis TaxID=404578 RepID=UPI000831DE28|nr:hypothetical protein [Nocardia amamiensis]
MNDGIVPDHIHVGNDGSMTGKPVAELLVRPAHHPISHSRPHVSDDNPYSEANFQTLPPSTTLCD